MKNMRKILKINNRIVYIIIATLCLMQAFSGCGLFGGNEEKPDKAVIEEIGADDDADSGEEKDIPTIVIKSDEPSESFAEDVTEDEKLAIEEAAAAQAEEETASESEPPEATVIDKLSCTNGQAVNLDPSWEYASYSKINSGSAMFYAAPENRNGIVVGVNAGHGTKGGSSVKTYCHPDMTPKVTGGTTAAGSIEAVAVSGGMSFNNGSSEASVNLRLAQHLRDRLLAAGYDVLMVRDGDDVQLDNIARTVICNNVADCHIAIHFDGDGLDHDKGCFFTAVPDGLKSMPPVQSNWMMCDELGTQIVKALSNHGFKLHNGGSMAIDLTQTSYSTIPSVDVEFGNQCTDTSDETLDRMAAATVDGIEAFFDVSN